MVKKHASAMVNSTLVVSPDERDEQILTSMLRSDSWRVRGARTFKEALRVLRGADRPNVVACERELPFSRIS